MIKIQRELNDETKMILKTTPHNIVQNPLAVAWFDMLTTLWRSVSCSGPLCADTRIVLISMKILI
jgi:hypothetical protein